MAGPDVRGRGLDFYWLKWENDIINIEKPIQKPDMNLNVGVAIVDPKEEKKK